MGISYQSFASEYQFMLAMARRTYGWGACVPCHIRASALLSLASRNTIVGADGFRLQNRLEEQLALLAQLLKHRVSDLL